MTYDVHELQARGPLQEDHASSAPLLASFQRPHFLRQLDHCHQHQISAVGLDVQHEEQRVQDQPWVSGVQ